MNVLPDLLNPIDGLMGRMTQGTMHRFEFAARGDYSGADVEMLLRQYGIPIWGREMEDPGCLAFQVRESQADWAEYLLCRAGVPLTSPLRNPAHARWLERSGRTRTMPTPWTEQGIGPSTFVARVVQVLWTLLGPGRHPWHDQMGRRQR